MSDLGTGMKQANAYNSDPWTFQIKPRHNELLSGYLCRVARAHGATPYGFCELQLGDKAFWARDFDRGVINHHDAVLIAKSGMSPERLVDMTLRSWIGRLTPTKYRCAERTAVIPWVNAAGVFHRTRRQHALQFCQECLAETETTFKTWRLSFVVICPVHKAVLLDACPECDAPFVPHRAPGRINRCHACHANLVRKVTSKGRSTEMDELTLCLQDALISNLTVGQEESQAATKRDEMRGLRGVISALFNQQSVGLTAEELGISARIEWLAGPRMELARHARRHQLMAASAVILEKWPESFQSVAKRLRLSQQGFGRLVGVSSNWLNQEIQKLPEGRLKNKRPSVRPKQSGVDRLEKERPRNWRAKRAAILLRAARKSA